MALLLTTVTVAVAGRGHEYGAVLIIQRIDLVLVVGTVSRAAPAAVDDIRTRLSGEMHSLISGEDVLRRGVPAWT
ncbi:MAG: hypothetical protein U5N26_01945 [Candidatus Marinimicrobia bacterium]|nr:hypothetical protein [Candidatus Neomarinimicrobiota bacterium]